MKLEVGKNIYQLRIHKGYTQETLAQLLHVSCAAVSKWENGYAYPDITTLPILARIFNVSIDDLLNFEKKLSEEQVKEIIQSLPVKFQTLPFHDAMEYTKGLVRTYPNSDYLKLKIAAAFMSLALFLSEEDLKLYADYAKSLCKELLQTENLQYRQSAAVQLVTFLSMEDRHQEALDILLSIPKLADTLNLECTLYCRLKNYDKAKELLQTQLYVSLNMMGMSLFTLMDLADKQENPQDVREYIHFVEALNSLFHIDIMMSNQLFYPYAKLKDKENTLKYLKKYIEQLQNFDDYPMQLQQKLSTYPWFSNIKLSPNNYPKGAMQNHIRSMLDEMKYIDFIRDTPEFQEVLDSIADI